MALVYVKTDEGAFMFDMERVVFVRISEDGQIIFKLHAEDGMLTFQAQQCIETENEEIIENCAFTEQEIRMIAMALYTSKFIDLMEFLSGLKGKKVEVV